MTGLRPWRASARAADGPYLATAADIPALNTAFSEAFTERYRKDGLVGVRVPALNPLIWRYALADAGEGAILWRGDRGEVVAFNVAHHSGDEGWMGPLAVAPPYQGRGLGKAVVTAGVEWLRARGARTIGLETMPRTMDNIGFYSALGFVPGRLTLTVTLDAAAAARPPVLLGRLPRAAHAAGDLLFFFEREDGRVTHVGVAAGGGRMLHVALGRGGFVEEDLAGDDDPYVATLRGRFVGARRVLG